LPIDNTVTDKDADVACMPSTTCGNIQGTRGSTPPTKAKAISRGDVYSATSTSAAAAAAAAAATAGSKEEIATQTCIARP
jgi:hypothetical protein